MYLIVGAPAAYGAERPTDDADCVMRRDRANLDRLAGALRELRPLPRRRDDRRRSPYLTVQIDATTLDLATRPFRGTVLLGWATSYVALCKMRPLLSAKSLKSALFSVTSGTS